MNESTFGREPITIVEIDQDFCQLTYGVSPCEARLGVTGDRKCFNTFATCQDPEHFVRGILTLRFSEVGVILPDEACMPFVTKVTTAPTEINPGGSGASSEPLGKRARVTVDFIDAPHSDIGVDPYVNERDYNPMERGTFWTKWLARNPYYNNRTIRILEGYVDQPLNEMVTRTYLIEKIEGPDAKGKVRLTARDVLMLADDEKAQAPVVSTGVLVNEMDDSETTDIEILVEDANEYPSSGTVRIGDELITYAGKSIIPDGIKLTGITRATDGSEVDSHSEEDRVQVCLRYTESSVTDLAYEWLTIFGHVPPEFIDKPAWDEEFNEWLAQFELTGLVTEPISVKALLSEITEQCLMHIWWDERSRLIRLEAIKPPETEGDVPRIDSERNIVADSVVLSDDPKSRASQVLVYWGQRNPTEALDKESNYRHILARVDAEMEAPEAYGERAIKKIFSRWLRSDGQAVNVGVRLLSRYKTSPKYLTLTLDAKDRWLWTGDICDVYCRQVVDDTGLPQGIRWQIVSAEEKVAGHSVTYKLFAYEFKIGARFGRWMEEDESDYEAATELELETGMWWADENGKVGDGESGYSWI